MLLPQRRKGRKENNCFIYETPDPIANHLQSIR